MAEKTLVSCYDGTMVKVGDQLRRYDKGVALPSDADEEHVKVLLDRGMVEEGEPSGGFVQDPGAVAPFVASDDEPKRGHRSSPAKDE